MQHIRKYNTTGQDIDKILKETFIFLARHGGAYVGNLQYYYLQIRKYLQQKYHSAWRQVFLRISV